MCLKYIGIYTTCHSAPAGLSSCRAKRPITTLTCTTSRRTGRRCCDAEIEYWDFLTGCCSTRCERAFKSFDWQARVHDPDGYYFDLDRDIVVMPTGKLLDLETRYAVGWKCGEGHVMWKWMRKYLGDRKNLSDEDWEKYCKDRRDLVLEDFRSCHIHNECEFGYQGRDYDVKAELPRRKRVRPVQSEQWSKCCEPSTSTYGKGKAPLAGISVVAVRMRLDETRRRLGRWRRATWNSIRGRLLRFKI